MLCRCCKMIFPGFFLLIRFSCHIQLSEKYVPTSVQWSNGRIPAFDLDGLSLNLMVSIIFLKPITRLAWFWIGVHSAIKTPLLINIWTKLCQRHFSSLPTFPGTCLCGEYHQFQELPWHPPPPPPGIRDRRPEWWKFCYVMEYKTFLTWPSLVLSPLGTGRERTLHLHTVFT